MIVDLPLVADCSVEAVKDYGDARAAEMRERIIWYLRDWAGRHAIAIHHDEGNVFTLLRMLPLEDIGP